MPPPLQTQRVQPALHNSPLLEPSGTPPALYVFLQKAWWRQGGIYRNCSVQKKSDRSKKLQSALICHPGAPKPREKTDRYMATRFRGNQFTAYIPRSIKKLKNKETEHGGE